MEASISMNTTIIGIDPGKKGGIAWITEGKPCAEKMPDTLRDLCELIQDIASNGNCHVYLEQVHASSQMGVVSAFTFGNGFGHLEMALTCVEVPFTRVLPVVWQRYLGCLTGGDKKITKQRAQELYPTIKITHYIADALLIATYGVKQH